MTAAPPEAVSVMDGIALPLDTKFKVPVTGELLVGVNTTLKVSTPPPGVSGVVPEPSSVKLGLLGIEP